MSEGVAQKKNSFLFLISLVGVLLSVSLVLQGCSEEDDPPPTCENEYYDDLVAGREEGKTRALQENEADLARAQTDFEELSETKNGLYQYGYDEAYAIHYNQNHQIGYDDEERGFPAGRRDGRAQGIIIGLENEDVHDQGLVDGAIYGDREGYSQGIADGEFEGYHAGREEGRPLGYIEGILTFCEKDLKSIFEGPKSSFENPKVLSGRSTDRVFNPTSSRLLGDTRDSCHSRGDREGYNQNRDLETYQRELHRLISPTPQYIAGGEAGKEQGKIDGLNEGIAQGYADGVEAGKIIGIEEGEAINYQQAFDEGCNRTYQAAYDKGKPVGYHDPVFGIGYYPDPDAEVVCIEADDPFANGSGGRGDGFCAGYYTAWQYCNEVGSGNALLGRFVAPSQEKGWKKAHLTRVIKGGRLATDIQGKQFKTRSLVAGPEFVSSVSSCGGNLSIIVNGEVRPLVDPNVGKERVKAARENFSGALGSGKDKITPMEILKRATLRQEKRK